ncbi:FAD-dependent oxidoreductase [Halobacteriales archaeon QS_1_68_17]|nr:MAG: FAD-dependent oxidoreductase [Halobacteriales archaeon QS_1_68_17]
MCVLPGHGSMEVVVIGGGISGMASAYYLSERDGVEVTLCEQGENIGSGSTPRAVGGMRSLYSTPVHVEMSLASLEVWNGFEEEFGIEIDYKNNGYLFGVRSRTQYETLRGDIAMQNQLGAVTEFITPEEGTEHVPELKTENYMAMGWDPAASMADPHACLQAFSQLARENGVQILTDHQVTDVRQDGAGRARGVEINGGEREIDADYVVNAAGPWGHRVSAMVDVEVPITPKKRMTAIMNPEKEVPDDAPLFIDLGTGAYFRPWDMDRILAGGHFEDDDPTVDPDNPQSFQDTVDLEWADMAMEALMSSSDYFGLDTEIVRAWSGVYAITPSNHPIIEESVPGFVNNVGHSGRAFMHSPASGELVAEIAVDGEASLVDTTALRTDDGRDTRRQLPIPYTKDTYD